MDLGKEKLINCGLEDRRPLAAWLGGLKASSDRFGEG